MKLLITAVEDFGDALGAALVQALRRRIPDLQIIGCGGARLENEGLQNLVDIAPFSVIGPVGALKALPAARRAADLLAAEAVTQQPDCAVFIDSWSFSKMVAEKMRKAAPDVKRIKFVAPQVWASRPERAQTLPQFFEHLLCLFNFEAPFFTGMQDDVRIVGHSGFRHAMEHQGDGARLRDRFDIGDKPLLAILPGSRPAEISRHKDVFGEVIKLLSAKHPDLQCAVAVAPAVQDRVLQLSAEWPQPVHLVQHEYRYDLFAAADAALAASGTVTTELAIHGTPMVVCYSLDLLSILWVRMVATASFASLLNIEAGEAVIPEFLGQRLDPLEIATTLGELLTPGGEARAKQIEAFPALLERLIGAGPKPADVAADAIIGWCGQKSAEKS